MLASSRFGQCRKKEILLRPFTLEDETTMLPQNAGIEIPSDTTSHTKTELWTESYPLTVCRWEYKWRRPKINKDNFCVKVKQWKFRGTMYNLTFPINELVESVRCVSYCVSRYGTTFRYRKIQFFLYSHIIESLN